MKLNKFILGLLTVAVLLFALAKPAHAQVNAGITAVTNLPTVVNSATISNTTSYIPVTKDSGLGIGGSFWTSTGTSNVVFKFAPSVDGTNGDSSPWVLTRAATATTTNYWTTNWSAAALRGYQGIFVSAETNQNASIITNGPINYYRPPY